SGLVGRRPAGGGVRAGVVWWCQATADPRGVAVSAAAPDTLSTPASAVAPGGRRVAGTRLMPALTAVRLEGTWCSFDEGRLMG
ncbi:hypothetical protein, partial [Catellatospora sp. NPDC049609]|uniref:hypothetical protein n=1 Tax=Catellatospora sp. NPDC049609 TaxID=3155505 RepID=UPI00343DCC37